MLIVCLAIHWIAVVQGASDDQVRTLVFIALTAGNLALVRVNDTRQIALLQLFAPGHLAFWAIASVASAIVGICILVPGLRGVFGFEVPDPLHAALAVAVTFLAVLALDLVKLLRRS